MQPSSSTVKPPSEGSSWEDIIKYFNQHSNQVHPCFKRHPACELCYPTTPVADSTWDTFFDWYKNYFSAVNYSGETIKRYKTFKGTIQNLIEKPITDQLKEDTFSATARLIGSIQYAFSAN